MRPPVAAGVLVALGLGVYAWWAVDRPPFSAGATVAVVGAGLVAVIVGARGRRRATVAKDGAAAWSTPGPPHPSRGRASAACTRWVMLAVVAAAWQLASFVQEPREDHPTVSSLANGMLDSHGARAAAFVVWLLATRELARR